VSSVLAGILFLAVVLAVAVLITVDVLRTPNEASAEQHAHAREPVLTGARGGPVVQAFPREPAAWEQPVPVAGAQIGSGPLGVGSSGPPDQAAHVVDQTPPQMPPDVFDDRPPRGQPDGMFVNLSRRSQALVERQLRLIESLEHGEYDQQRLASLSRLNRIALRIHRNSQNLLILAGQEPATGWSQPVTLDRVIEAALSEVEEYERISAEIQSDVAVRGPAVHDAAHLLVELLDNATSFSAADMPVHVTGQVLTTGGALVDITDRGIGMNADEMAYANQQLDNPPPDVDVPKWMGLLVVARLAARHGIRIRLSPADAGGLTAMVWFPDEILIHYSAVADPGNPAAARQPAASPPAFGSARMNGPAAQPAPNADRGVVVPRADSRPTMLRP
jgi:hypothetical protein